MFENEQDNKRLEELYEEFRFDCINIALRITNNLMMAEDAVQDAFLAVIKHKDKMLTLNYGDFRKSIIIIVKNKCIDIIRKNKHLSSVSLEDVEYELRSEYLSVEIQVIRQEDFMYMLKCIAELDETSRLVLLMKYVQGLSYKEIGNVLGMTTKHVDTRIMRAKQKVRKLIEVREMKELEK
jgi:RNA polymerase sigma-70 factor, ECF subfamily